MSNIILGITSILFLIFAISYKIVSDKKLKELDMYYKCYIKALRQEIQRLEKLKNESKKGD